MQGTQTKKRINLYLPMDLVEKIERCSAQKNLPPSSYIRDLLAKEHEITIKNITSHSPRQKPRTAKVPA